MKFRLKIGHLFGPLAPQSNNGRTYGMYMVPWIKAVKGDLGLGLKETKNLADCLRDSIENGANSMNFHGATTDVDAAEFPYLLQFSNMPKGTSDYIEVIEDSLKYKGLACTVGPAPGRSVEIIKAAMRELIDINSWSEVRRLADVLMDIEDEQSV